MKICLVSPFPPARGGIAAFARKIHDGLVQNGADLEVVPMNSLFSPLTLLPALRRIRPDILRIEYAISMYVPGLLVLIPVLWLVARTVRCKMTATYHEPVRDMALLGWLGRIHYRWVSKIFDRIYVHTQEAKETLIRKAGLPPQQIKILPFGTYDFPDRTDRLAEFESRYNLGDREVVLFFGFIHLVKGIDDFIKAARRILDRYEDDSRDKDRAKKPLFVVAGAIRRRQGVMRLFEIPDHNYRRRLFELRETLGLEEDVRFLGYIENPFVFTLIQRAKVVVVPYTTAEQSSLLNMAIPLGKPTVASSLGGHREMLGEIGGLVPVGEPDRYAEEIYRFLEDPAAYERVVTAYRELNERENTRSVTRILLEDLQEIVQADS